MIFHAFPPKVSFSSLTWNHLSSVSDRFVFHPLSLVFCDLHVGHCGLWEQICGFTKCTKCHQSLQWWVGEKVLLANCTLRAVWLVQAFGHFLRLQTHSQQGRVPCRPHTARRWRCEATVQPAWFRKWQVTLFDVTDENCQVVFILSCFCSLFLLLFGGEKRIAFSK